MSIRTMLFGTNPAASILLKVIDLDVSDIPRFRGCYIVDGQIMVRTRTGGDNREVYEEECEENPEGPWNSTLRQNPYHLSDNDSEDDCTCAEFYFEVPDAYKADIDALVAGNDEYTPSENWKALAASMAQA